MLPTQNGRRRLHFSAQREFACLLRVQTAEQVGAEADFQSGITHQLEAPQGMITHFGELPDRPGRHRTALGRIEKRSDDDERRHDESTGRLDCGSALLIYHRGVLDRPDSQSRGASDGARRMTMRGDILPAPLCFLNCRRDLVVGELIHPDGIAWRQHTPQHQARCNARPGGVPRGPPP